MTVRTLSLPRLTNYFLLVRSINVLHCVEKQQSIPHLAVAKQLKGKRALRIFSGECVDRKS